MSDAIASISSGQAIYQPKVVAPMKPEVREETPQPKGDTVTISAQGKQEAQKAMAGSSPTEEMQETTAQKASEAS